MFIQKLKLLYEFVYQGLKHCLQFLQQDPIEQSSQIITSNYQAANKDEKQGKQLRQQEYTDLEDQDADHDQHLIEQENPFEKLQPTLNFQNTIKQEEKEQIKYDEELVDFHQNTNWHNNNELEQENEHIEL